MLETGTLLQNRYLIETQIGKGGMGAVYAAVDQRFGSRVAIKETFYKEADLGEAFELEARLLNSLHHPILPHVSDYFTEDSGYFLVMEFIEGEDLSEILKREGAFPVPTVLHWIDELLDGLDYLHSQEEPIIHRDIKPNNLKLTTRGNIVLLDFGLAKLNAADHLGMKSVFGYSRTYSPLEQIQGTGTDARSDIFSLGATAYHLLTGKPPIDVLARASAIIAGRHDPLQLASEINPEVSLPVAQVLQTALALNAERRFISADAMRKALKFAINTEATLDAEALPEQAASLAASADQALSSAETENFPALASFAADTEAQNSPETQNGGVQVRIPVVRTPSQAPKVSHEPVAVNAATQSGSPRNSFLKAAVWAAIFFSGVSAIWYVTSGAKSSNESNQAPAVSEPSPVLNADTKQPTTIPVSPTLEVSPAPILEKEKTSQSKQAPKTKETVAETPKIPDNLPAPEVAKPDKPERAQNRTVQPHSVPAPTPRRTNTPRPVEQPAVSSIERVMTGEAPERQQPTQRREERRQRREMSEGEKEELRRRRTEDILRQNRQPTPPR
ncbi:MAG TPA: protein kinase [Pyrinomonadaceae bacterium]|jgi:serine/threonine protein kinase